MHCTDLCLSVVDEVYDVGEVLVPHPPHVDQGVVVGQAGQHVPWKRGVKEWMTSLGLEVVTRCLKRT